MPQKTPTPHFESHPTDGFALEIRRSLLVVALPCRQIRRHRRQGAPCLRGLPRLFAKNTMACSISKAWQGGAIPVFPDATREGCRDHGEGSASFAASAPAAGRALPPSWGRIGCRATSPGVHGRPRRVPCRSRLGEITGPRLRFCCRFPVSTSPGYPAPELW